MRGTLTGQRYADDILRPHVGAFLNGLPGAIFQQDNARPHTARVAQDYLRHFQTLPWPARSSDLSPEEHVWDQLKPQMPSCHSLHDLEFAVQDLWRHHRSPTPQFRFGTAREGNILQHQSLMVSVATAHKTFGPTVLTSEYSVCTWRVFGGIEPRPSGLESEIINLNVFFTAVIELLTF
ncbi:transposable element Tcb2 transposase [Trichonephila clavipes]|nr:transposable element Tcb2 transposase [Trichonephila clavipes]